MDKRVCLMIPYVSEFVSYEILRYINKCKLPINVILVPGTKLRNILCSSRPLDKPGCTLTHSKISDLLEDDVNCNFSCPVYKITCRLCNEVCIGESSRTLLDGLSEHLQYASNPNKPSYKEEALATDNGLQPIIVNLILGHHHLSVSSLFTSSETR